MQPASASLGGPCGSTKPSRFSTAGAGEKAFVASIFGQRKLSRDGCGVSSKIFVKRKGLVEWKIKKKGGYIGCILICRTSLSFFARGEKRAPTSPPSEAEGGARRTSGASVFGNLKGVK